METSFDIFWNAYDKKVGIDKSMTKWALVTAKDQILIMNHVHGFVAKHRNKQFRPNPLSYLNGKMWLDESIQNEEKILLSAPKVQNISQEPSKSFDPAIGKAFIVNKIQKSYETGIRLNDVGEVFTRRLKPFLSTPDDAMGDIVSDAYKRFHAKPKNRFEEKVELNYNLEVRNGILKYNMEKWVQEKREIWREL